MLRRLGHQLRGPRKVAIRRWDDANRPVDDRLHERHGRGLPDVALEDHVELGQRERAEQERFIGTPEPADRGGVVQVVAIGRGDDGARVEQDRHVSGTARDARSRAGRSTGRRARGARARSGRPR